MTGVAQVERMSPIESPQAFVRLAHRHAVCWLDSSLRRAGDGRFSILACDPRWTFWAKGDEWSSRDDNGRENRGRGPLAQLDRLLVDRRCQAPAEAPLPFCGGAIGWLAYDLGRQFERVDGDAHDDLGVPDIWLAWFDAALVWDHFEANVWLVGVPGDDGRRAMHALRAALEAGPSSATAGGTPSAVACRSDFEREDYIAGVAAVRDGIARGEYYQLNLVQRFACPMSEPATATYLRLREVNPAPFAAYIGADEAKVLSSSPERFLEVSADRRVRTCPIKGTRPRTSDPSEDADRARQLLASDKERAELLMIVDLLRNDMGRVCRPGTVEVTRLNALESFATVHHLVGEVAGELRPDITLAELIRAVFPGGSITGAPKVSAMRAIDRLEPHRRGIGMGAIGYFSANGRIDLNIAIRTIVCRGGMAYVPVGAGIVWDSDPATEYEETLAKAKALFAALGAKNVTP